MESKATFDLDHNNIPVIKLEIKSSPDVRDKIAKRFIENLRHQSQWCVILPNGENEFLIWALEPHELREVAEDFIKRAEQLDKQKIIPEILQ